MTYNELMSLFSGDGKQPDSDMILILLFMMVLYKNGADMKLLLALGYILL